MARLSDLVHLSDQTFIHIQGQKVPAMLNFTSINAIEEAYGKGYAQFEKDLNTMLKRKVVKNDRKTMNLVWSLVYGLLIGGGTECTFDEMNRAIPFADVPNVVGEALAIMKKQGFQDADAKK
ncbi:hypothetical protein DA798_09625 [Lactobacillus sp. PFC-70]|uniref:hypothetical protein n=1 Tax=Levilactobacillus namurensis TaxID=380393 RepID=UPI000D31DD41|nr:hypothetical protein [Levilactobacillus namurensis]MCW3778512.1 hypothetical protein [Levilactobacillus namurensis]MDT7019567.1 hypothetical protein [Levilactobacillus namurensis]PTM21542.1 hypothetical protein DA798_09625 [Lactobacillus sp. PFC-70]WNN65845.1 hypothetical protein RIN67_01770 [Levilactobacillus namurensis]